MNKKPTLRFTPPLILRKFNLLFLLILLSFTACTQDELADNNADALPEGQYPLQIGNITISGEGSVQPWGARQTPQTRAVESTDGSATQWEEGDVFYAKFGDSDQTGTYRIEKTEAGYAPTAVEPLYWRSKTQQETLIAWYTEPGTDANGTLNLSDQEDGLAYVLRAETTAAYTTEKINLNFTHQLAKVRVMLTTEGYTFTDTPAVYLKGITSCTRGEGNTFAPSEETGYISTHTVTAGQVYEATLWPQEGIGKDFLRLTDGTKSATATLEQSLLNLEAGRLYTFHITVRPDVLTLTLVSELPGWGTADQEETI